MRSIIHYILNSLQRLHIDFYSFNVTTPMTHKIFVSWLQVQIYLFIFLVYILLTTPTHATELQFIIGTMPYISFSEFLILLFYSFLVFALVGFF